MKRGRTSIGLNLLMVGGGLYGGVSIIAQGHTIVGMGFGLMALSYVARVVRDICILRRARIETLVRALKLSAATDLVVWSVVWASAFAVTAWAGLTGQGHMAVLAALAGLALTPWAAIMIYGSRLTLREIASAPRPAPLS